MKQIVSFKTIILLSIPLLLGCDFLTGPEESATYTFYGKVLDYDDDTPIDSAIVTIWKYTFGNTSLGKENLGKTISNYNGEYIFSIDALPSNRATLSVFKYGYRMPDEYDGYYPYRGISGSFGDKKIKKTDLKLKKIGLL